MQRRVRKVQGAAQAQPTFDRRAIDVCASKPDVPKFQVATIHISCQSDHYQGTNHSYGGFIVYGYEGKSDWYTVNGVHCKSGYLVIKDTDCHPRPQDEFPGEPGVIHGAIYRKVFGEPYKKDKVIGEGFSVMNGEFKTVSSSFNIGELYHDNRRIMNETMEECVKKVVDSWKASGRSFTAHRNYEVQALLND